MFLEGIVFELFYYNERILGYIKKYLFICFETKYLFARKRIGKIAQPVN